LFLFVIILLGAEKLERGTIQPWQRPAAIILAGILIAEAIYMSIAQVVPAAIAGDLPAEFGTPLAIGETLFNEYLLPFEVVSILLLAAMIGAIVLTKKGGLKRS
jgi:NADH-quinone oxidoreductase subunit J